MLPETVRAAPPDGEMVIDVHVPAFNMADTNSFVFPVIEIVMTKPPCADPLIAVKAAPNVVYGPLPAAAPASVTWAWTFMVIVPKKNNNKNPVKNRTEKKYILVNIRFLRQASGEPTNLSKNDVMGNQLFRKWLKNDDEPCYLRVKLMCWIGK